MPEQIGLLSAGTEVPTDPDPTVNDSDSFCATGAPGTPFIHGRDYAVDANSYRTGGTSDHSFVVLTYRLWGEPIKSSNAMPTGNTSNGSPTVSALSFTTGMQVGMRITGAGIQADTFITAINVGAGTLTMSRAATATASTVALAINSVFVGKVREWKFIRQMLGFPYIDVDASNRPVLRRNLPEPLRWSNGQWRFVDRRPHLRVTARTNSNTTLDQVQRTINGVATNAAVSELVGASVYGPGIPVGTTVAAVPAADTVTLSQAATASASGVSVTFIQPIDKTRRWTHWCTRHALMRGISPKAQKPGATMYPAASSGVPPEQQFAALDIDFTFEQLPYQVVIQSDLSWGGEYSRFVIYPEEASARFLQIAGGVQWDNAAGYGQPAAGNRVAGTVFAGKEGVPKMIGENVYTWKWIDVPIWGYDWDKIQQSFGKINNTDFPSTAAISANTLVAPFYVIPKECALFETAQRYQKNNVYGEPLWDIVFVFRSTPLDDRFGYWNRLYNNRGYAQRYKLQAGGADFFQSFDFANLFKPYGQWT